jgi:hypothetical protein
MYKNKETEGAGFGGEWNDVHSDKVNLPNVTGGVTEKNTQPGDFKTELLRNSVSLLAYLESNFAFTVVLISVIGYIIIASFGEIDNLKKYLGYVIFLMMAFTVYKLLKFFSENNNEINFFKKILTRKNLYYNVIITFFAIIIITQNAPSIYKILKEIFSLLVKYSLVIFK